MMNGKISEIIMIKVTVIKEMIEKKVEIMKKTDMKREIGILTEIGKKIEKEVEIKNGKRTEKEIGKDIKKEIEKNFLMIEIKDIVTIDIMKEIIIIIKEEKNHGIVIVNQTMKEKKKIFIIKIK